MAQIKLVSVAVSKRPQKAAQAQVRKDICPSSFAAFFSTPPVKALGPHCAPGNPGTPACDAGNLVGPSWRPTRLWAAFGRVDLGNPTAIQKSHGIHKYWPPAAPARGPLGCRKCPARAVKKPSPGTTC